MPIRVGIVGLSADPAAWSGVHLAVIKSNPDLYTLVALATSSPASAVASGKLYGVPAEKCYSSAEALAKDPDADLIVVSVKVRAVFPPFYLSILMTWIRRLCIINTQSLL
jgi:predicted dehydrogenase